MADQGLADLGLDAPDGDQITRAEADYLIALAIEKGISPGYGVELESWIEDEIGILVSDVGELTRAEYERVKKALEDT